MRSLTRRITRSIGPVGAVLLTVVALAACGSEDASAPAARSGQTATTAVPSVLPAGPLRTLLVNDDGIGNPAIDVMLGILAAEPDLEITVVAPSRDRSGTSDRLTPGRVTYEAAVTPGGIKGYAVDGFPGDAVVVAVEDLGLAPQLVVSGVNLGQNVGPVAFISGTVGAGRTAIRRGIPALAVSAGGELDQEQFAFAGRLALDWIRQHRAALALGTHQTDTVTSINVPTCPVARMGELREVALAPSLPAGVDVSQSSCDRSGPTPDTDVSAIIVGYPAITQVPADR